jgi:rRNA maturation RNase YbeY
MNRQYLQHDYYTDIITFDYNEGNSISGDLFISIDRITENAINFNSTFKIELFRVIIHGVLHLLGNADNTPRLKSKMHELEDESLERLFKILEQ